MLEITLREARAQLSDLLDQVGQGEEVIITRHGKQVARLMPVVHAQAKLPSLKKFRASFKIKGKALSRTIANLRKEERY